jgi:phage terminase large subunit
MMSAPKNVVCPWPYLTRFVQDLPSSVISKSSASVTLPNGASIRVLGANNPDALRGLYYDGLVVDEAGDIPHSVYTEVIAPSLADREGWVVFIGTPRGKNLFYELRNEAIKNETGDWFFPSACKLSFG